MKKIALSVICVVAALFLSSCGKEDYQKFVGTWGVEKIVYESYNTDFAGEPIEGTVETETYKFDPNIEKDGIQMVFRADKTGELRDNAIDTLYFVYDETTQSYVPYTIAPVPNGTVQKTNIYFLQQLMAVREKMVLTIIVWLSYVILHGTICG